MADEDKALALAEAERIRDEAGEGTLDYEQEALSSLARSWEHAAHNRTECVGFALADAQVWATLHLARVSSGVQSSGGE